ncbi:MAG TPA: pilus assembly protein TadG-related protein [Gaiellaceae bacterium]|nr:pilus assembly protein TadG-related protein [Gaiellaceae bacterium]
MITKRLLARRPTCVASRQEAGQVLALVVVALIPLLGMLGLALDIGYAYYSQRTLQSSADAAALAGAAQLPDAAGATGVATQYGSTAGSKNAVPSSGITGVQETVSEKCVASLPGCAPNNAVVVDESASATTFFLRLFGVSTVPIHVRATACGPCADRPADIVAVFDRTGSMCQTWSGANDPSCTKLHNAKSGMETMLRSLDPSLDRVGLVVLPPVGSGKSNCSASDQNAYNSTSSKWMLVPLTANYQNHGALDHSSTLVSTIDCLQAGGTTAYANAIEAAQAELAADARPGALRYIVFFTDGAANTGPTYYSTSSPYRTKPCHQGVTSAGVAKAANTTIFAIGYTLQGVGGTSNTCQSYTGATETGITAYSALQQIASRADTFFDNESVDGLDAVFAAVATRITGPRLIPNDLT